MYGTRTKTYQGKGAKLGETGKFEGEFKIHTNGTVSWELRNRAVKWRILRFDLSRFRIGRIV